MTRQTLYAGTIIHIFGVPAVLANDTEVDTATDLKWWQDEVANNRHDRKELDKDEG